MPDRRDPVEQGMDSLFGWVAGAITAFFIGAFLGRQAAKNRKTHIILPGTLEIDHTKTYNIHRKARGKSALGLLALSFMALIYALACGAIGVTIGLQRGNSWALLCSGFFMVFFGYFAYFWSSRYEELDAIQNPKLEVNPLNLATGRAYTVMLPNNTEWRPENAGRFMLDILKKLGGRLTFQIVADQQHIAWRVLDLRRAMEPTTIKQTIHAFYPNAEIVESGLSLDEFDAPFYRYVMTFDQGDEFLLPILKVDETTKFDPLVNLTYEMSQLEPGERVIYTLFVADFARFVYDQAEELLSVKLPALNLVEAGIDAATGGRAENRYEPNVQKLVEEKLGNFVCQCLLLIQVDARQMERVKVLSRMDSHTLQFKSHNLLVWHQEPWPDSIQYIDNPSKARSTSTFWLLGSWLTNQSKTWQQIRLLLDSHELASLWHLPHRDFSAPNIVWSRGKQVPMPAMMRGCREGVCLGTNRYAGREELVYMPLSDRDTHTAIVGRTGTGKSTLLHNLIYQDILRNRGVAVVDPHGALVRDVLRWSIPPSREKDVVVIDLANEAYPPPLNLLAIPPGLTHKNAADQIMAIMEKFGSFSDTVTVAPAMWAALMTLWQEETPTLRDVARVFDDEMYRNQLLDKLDNPAAEDFWDKFEAKTRGQQELLSSPVLHRISTFYGNSVLYPIMCHPNTLDFSSLIRQKKIILVSLKMDENRLPPQDQRLLGAILVSQIQMAAMAGAIKNPPYYLYIDEVQHFVTSSLPVMFSEARKHGLSLTIANQYLKQLAGDTLEAVIGNVGALIAFQCGLDDSKALAPYMRPGFEVDDLLNMDKFHAAAYMRFDGQTQPAFGLKTRPAPVEDGGAGQERPKERELRIRRLSIHQYTPISREKIMEWLKQRYPRRRRSVSGNMDETFSDPVDSNG